MIDLVGALLGRKHCAWCVDRPVSWWERLTNQDELGESPVRWKRLIVRAQFWLFEAIPVWKLGNSWHWRFHVAADDYRKVKGKWCESKKVGDIVCDCKGEHLRIVEFLDKDSVILEDGSQCSLYHCCGEPGDDCHHGISIEQFWDRKDDDAENHDT